jgi:N-acetylglucosaminyldiphosphoundecaprenol N-acetyl-beta-D-mannosaminyltransferase
MGSKLRILNLEISTKSENQLLDEILLKVEQNEKYLIHHVNPHILLLSQKNKKLEEALNKFSELFYDGIGIFLASKFLYGKNGIKNRMTGTDFYPKLLSMASQNHLKLFLLGGTNEATKKIEKIISKKFPGISLVENFSRETGITPGLIKSINTDILFVGLGSPKQEIWCADNFEIINSKLIICVGSGIDYLSGVYKRAPRFFQVIGMEWLWRLIYDPKRLAKRYLLGNFIYIFKIIKQKMGMINDKKYIFI